MNKTSEKMIELFKEYGFHLTEEEIKMTVEKATSSFEYGMSEYRYQENFFEAIEANKNEPIIKNFDVFKEKVQLEEKWAGMPEWLTSKLRLSYSERSGTLYISNRKFISYAITNDDVLQQDVSYFEKKLGEATNGAYQLKKIFNAEETEQQLMEEIKKESYKLAKEIIEKGMMKEFTEKMRSLSIEMLRETDAIFRKLKKNKT